MKTLLLVPAMALPLCAGNVTLLWELDEDPTRTGVRLYWRDNLVSYNTVDVGQDATAYTLNGLPPGHYQFWLTAFNSDGVESDPSNDVEYDVVIPSPFALTAQELTFTWSGVLTTTGLIKPTVAILTQPGAGITAVLSSPAWGSVTKGGTADTNGVVKLIGKPTPIGQPVTVDVFRLVTDPNQQSTFTP